MAQKPVIQALARAALSLTSGPRPGSVRRVPMELALDRRAPSRQENRPRGEFMAGASSQANVATVPQPVSAPLSRAAIFLVATINPGADNARAVRAFCADFSGLVRAVEFRDLEAGLSCVMGIGSDAWDRLFGDPRPAELHPFREFTGGSRHAVATPGDLLFHIRAKRMDLCFEMAAQIMGSL